MENRDRMVVRLPVLFQDPDRPARLACGAEKDILEKGLVDMIRARTSEKQTAWQHMFDRVPV